jgi:hypothetical protein
LAISIRANAIQPFGNDTRSGSFANAAQSGKNKRMGKSSHS